MLVAAVILAILASLRGDSHLRPGKCGKNVSAALRRSYAIVAQNFDKLDDRERKANCDPFQGLKLGLLERTFIEWDLGVLYLYRGLKCDEGGLSPLCLKTVEVGGKCYSAGNVNYILWGWMNRLCGFSEDTMVRNIWLWKGLAYGVRGLQDARGASAWARAGYRLSYDPGYTPGRHKCCTSCNDSYMGHLAPTWPHSDW